MSSGAGRRRIASLVLAMLGALILLLGGVLLYARDEIFDSDAFADRAVTALQHDEVAGHVATAIVDELIVNAEPDLINARPLLVSVVSGVVESGPFRGIFRHGVLRVHRTVFTNERDRLVLGLADAVNLAIEGLQTVAPRLAAEVPRGVQPKLTGLVDSEVAIDMAQLADKVRALGIVLPFAGFMLLGGAVLVDRDRRRGFLGAAVSVAVVTGVGYACLLIVKGTATRFTDPGLEAAAKQTFDAFFGDLQKELLVGVVASLIIASAVGSDRRVDALDPLRRATALAAAPATTPLRKLLRAFVALALGVFLLAEHQLALTIVVLVAGAYAVFFGLSELLAVLAPASAERREHSRRAADWRRWVRPAVASAAIVGLIAIAVAVTGGGEKKRSPGSIERCNGFRELCDRPIDQVVFPGVHNAMSAARDGYLLANNERGVGDQLQAGARALLIDAHWGYRGTHGVVITDLAAEGGESKAREEAVATTSEKFVTAAERLVKTISTSRESGADRQVYFCHVFCELGSTPGAQLLTEVRKFLDTHPDEVVILFVEDYVAPAAMARIFEQSGLDRYLYTPRPDGSLPTLRRMIASNKRAYVMSENTGGGAQFPWYQEGFALTQETPFTFNSPSALAARSSCDPNRGKPRNPLFQLNHWVEEVPRSPKTAEVVNARDFLLKRARMCARIRNQLPNMLAVDFWERGDLFGVARELNGIPAGEKPNYAPTG